MYETEVSTKFYSKHNQNQDEELLKPFKYLDLLKSKEYQHMLKIFRSVNVWLNIQQEKMEEVLNLVNKVAANIVIVDDLQDSSAYRFGLPSAHIKFGLPATIGATNLVTFIMMEKFLDLHGVEAVTIYKDYGMTLFRGQTTEIYWKENLQCPSEEEYMKMIINKSSSICLMVIKLMQLFSDNKTDLTKIGKMLGVFMQLYNDYINLVSVKYLAEKNIYCEDITGGMFTFPIIHAIRSRPDDTRIMDILKMETTDPEIIKKCIALLEKTGSILYTKQTLLRLKEDILEESERIGKNPQFRKILEDYYNEFISDI